MGAEFADKYPKIASRLQLEPDKCEDPHVERLIEAFAFLAARVRLKIDDEFPEITESLLGHPLPHFLAPVPSMSIVQFVLDPEQVSLQTGQTIPRARRSRPRPSTGSRAASGPPIRSRSGPSRCKAARFEQAPAVTIDGRDARTMLRLDLRILGGAALSELKEKVVRAAAERPLSSLRFYLQGEGKVVHALYELLFNDALAVELRPGGRGARLRGDRPGAARLSGPSASATTRRSCRRRTGSFRGYRLLQEYFAFPEKFLFVDLDGLERLEGRGFTDTLDVRILLRRDPSPRNGASRRRPSGSTARRSSTSSRRWPSRSG